MSVSVDWQKLNIIFQSRQDILEGIKRCADTPGKAALFNEIASHVFDKFQTPTEPDTKRRKIQEAPAGTVANASDAGKEPVFLVVKEISVSVPQRKKFELCFTSGFVYARAPGTTTPVPGMIYSWNDIEYAFYLPVPDKAQVQHNYLLFPRGTCLPSKTNPPSQEPLVFTVPATAPKEGTISGSEASSASAVSDTYKTLFHWAINARLRSISSSTEIVSADPNKFQSVIRQAHRPNEKSVHVTGFRGSKDGYLFFLENGILWGFKKPLLFIPLKRIAAVSYTNILQITFNVVIEVFGEDGETTEELEFGMIDQQDYAGIDAYLKTKNLQDGSMAEQRKAKLQLAENKGRKGTDSEQNGDANGLTELERAQQDADQQMDDEDDEEEDEDFDPGSGGDSEGSGESDDDDDDDDDDDEGEGGDDDDDDGEDGEEEEEDEDGDEQPGLSLR